MRLLPVCIVFTLTIFLLYFPIFAEEPAAHDHIRIDLKQNWERADIANSGIPIATKSGMKLSGEFAKFTCNEPGARGTFATDFELPIEMTTYPMMTLRYRANNIDIKNTLTCIWIVEGRSAATFPLIDFDKLIVDGQIHEMTIDLPKAPVDSNGTPFESGPVKGIRVSVMNTEAGEGSLELLDLDFASATEPPRDVVDDAPLTVRVLDQNEHPIANATVKVDTERKDAARTTKTDSAGAATLTPVKNELDQHTLSVEATGQVPAHRVVNQTTTDALDFELPKAMQVGGFVQDENGKPIHNARVRIFARLATTPDPLLHIRYTTSVQTDENGQWLSPPLPDTPDIYLTLSHPDYQSDHTLVDRKDIADELRSGIATIQMKK